MKAISFPLTLDPFGNTNSTTSQTKIYQDRVLTLLSTVVGERPMRPTYGTDVASAMFESQTDAVTAATTAIQSAIKTWIPEITVEDVIAKTTDDSGRLEVLVRVILPDFTSANITAYTTVLNQNGSTTR